MIPTPITFDDDRINLEYAVYVCRTDTVDQPIDLEKGRTHDIREAMTILHNLPTSLDVVQQPGVVAEAEPIDGLNHRIIVWRDASVIAVLHAWIQIEQARQTSEVR